jgi:predicted phosphate transport protein (TIGR00153 family)
VVVLEWFRALMPKEDRFFGLFEQHATLVVAGAESLRAGLEGGPALRQHLQTVMDRENEADAITREVILAVRRTFITPFDRGDIKDLITAMDDAIDQMQKTAKTILLFKVTQFEPEMSQMADRIVQAAVMVQQAMPLLRSISTHAAEIGSLTEHVSRIEGETDDLHDAGRSRLYEMKGPEGALHFWVASEILDHLEGVMDRLEDVANEIHGTMIEHV